MAKRMLIDAAHPEETRVVVTSGHRLEEFDFESSTKKQVKGNIYLAKVTRVEPSLQAAFVDYGGNRHGFLAFSEVHPDYYRIPVSDRQNGEAENSAESNPSDGDDDAGVPISTALPEPVAVGTEPSADEDSNDEAVAAEGDDDESPAASPADDIAVAETQAVAEVAVAWSEGPAEAGEPWPRRDAENLEPAQPAGEGDPAGQAPVFAGPEAEPPGEPYLAPPVWDEPVGYEADASGDAESRAPDSIALRAAEESLIVAEPGELSQTREHPAEGNGVAGGGSVETFGGDEAEDVEEADAERRRTQPARHYKIQEVIKRRQIMLVQVAKEERGNKGAALTTYLSLAGRYCVLMPNTNRGGGVSRKITSIADRRRLKDILEDLDIPEGMGVIVRTAGAERSKAEIKRDYEYLLRLWNEIRDLTLNSTAPALIYEEGNLIKRSIRDLYTRDLDEVLVEGEEGYKTAKAFMRTLMPSHAKRVQPYRDPQVPLFQRFQIESQIDAIHSPVAQLRSGGYIVINQTEALVSIDVNSGRSTRERNIEETALRTNLEAAEEIARQLRLRDLAGLIVIDFIDMEEHRNQIAVERRLKEALKNDRARIQVGRISPFGLLEMSRQRLRPSLAETSTQPCPHCGGTGFIRSVESTALYVLRSIEEEGIRRRSAEICVYVPTNVALYILNQKRDSLAQIEARYGIKVMVARDDSLIPPNFRLERLRAFGVGEAPPLRAIQAPVVTQDEDEEEEQEVFAEAAETEGGDEHAHRRRRRRRPRRSEEAREPRHGHPPHAAEAAEAGEPAVPEAPDEQSDAHAEAERRRRRRGRRGGRIRGRREFAPDSAGSEEPVAAETIEVVPMPEEDRSAEPNEEVLPPLETWAPASEVETASLAPFAGDPAAEEPLARAHDEPETPQSEPIATAESETAVPFVSDSERRFEEPAPEPPVDDHHEESPAPAARSSEDLLVVTEKPANPRRGWWQRLSRP